ncbi:MAG: LytTR family DNA-binding domain-containing protein, partial [Catalinimonas sp.]
YALEGFQLDVLDYLLKPITFDRFFKAVVKAHDLWTLRRRADQTPAALAAAVDTPEDDSFFIKVDNRYEQVRRQEVHFVEARQNYVLLHTDRGRFLTLLTMKSAEEQLPPPAFLRVHKSYVVAAAHVDAVEGNQLHVGEHRIPVGRQYREQVAEELVNRRLWRK